MLNRRHLRVKVLQALYAYYQSEEESYNKTEKEMMDSIERIYHLYLYLLLTFDEIKTNAERKIEESKQKIRPTEEDLNPNRKFVENKVFEILSANPFLRRASEEHKVNWIGAEEQEILKKVFKQIQESEEYLAYMHAEENSFEQDLAFACSLFKVEIANSPLVYSYFEEKRIDWMDDIDLACSMVLKTLKTFTPEGENDILPLYKDPEDEKQFVRTLLRKTIARDSENLVLIDDLIKNWELDRIAKMDILLLKMAITELQEFNNIPTKVTLNEYIEISKYYSTPKSSNFINGVLDKAVEILTKDNKINKIGRGLMQ
jgi:transcription antitermination protein NusB